MLMADMRMAKTASSAANAERFEGSAIASQDGSCVLFPVPGGAWRG